MIKQTDVVVFFMDKDFKCPCGNDINSEGFIPCNKNGEEVSLSMSSGRTKCNKCESTYLYLLGDINMTQLSTDDWESRMRVAIEMKDISTIDFLWSKYGEIKNKGYWTIPI